MKNNVSILMLCLITFSVYGQPEPAKQMAEKIAIRMKDSLNLSQQQKQLIYEANILLFNRKAEVRQQYKGNTQLNLFIQKVENTRDSLYMTVLPEEKYWLYKERKKYLIHNN